MLLSLSSLFCLFFLTWGRNSLYNPGQSRTYLLCYSGWLQTHSNSPVCENCRNYRHVHYNSLCLCSDFLSSFPPLLKFCVLQFLIPTNCKGCWSHFRFLLRKERGQWVRWGKTYTNATKSADREITSQGGKGDLSLPKICSQLELPGTTIIDRPQSVWRWPMAH